MSQIVAMTYLIHKKRTGVVAKLSTLANTLVFTASTSNYYTFQDGYKEFSKI